MFNHFAIVLTLIFMLNLSPLKAEEDGGLGFIQYIKSNLNSTDQSNELNSQLEEAEKYLTAGKFTEAIEGYQKLVAMHPSNARIQLGLAGAYLQSGKRKEARNIFKNLVESQPENKNVWAQVGVGYFLLSEYKKSVEYLTNAVKYYPNLPDLYRMLAISQIHLKQYEDAKVNFSKAKDIYLKSLNLSSAGFMDRFIKATDEIERNMIILKNNPKDDHAYLPIGMGYSLLGTHQEAIVALKKAMILNPENPRIFSSLGYAYFSLKQFRNAIVFLKEAVRIYPNDPEDFKLLGVCYLGVQDIPKAKEALVIGRNIAERKGDMKTMKDIDQTLEKSGVFSY